MTLRQNLRITLGGAAIRFRFSNEFGDGPLVIGAARVALSAGGSAIVPGSDAALTFDGGTRVMIPAGGSVLSDPVSRELPPLTALTVYVRIDTIPPGVTGHPGSRTTSYIAPGDATDHVDLADAVPVEHWYVLSGAETRRASDSRVVITLGNSITDGRGSTTNGNDRWPDILAQRILADSTLADVAVVNAGIGGNTVVRGGLGPTALSRLDRDVLDVAGARWVVVLEGINDIGGSSPDNAATVANELILGYQEIARRAHERGLLVYGATLLPFGDSFYDSPEKEAARQTVNEWIRTSPVFDAVIDFDAAMRDPAKPSRLRSEADTGDHLHPNAAGYRIMAEFVDMGLFRERG
jgi:lysophospholipase L1-like esterase